MSPEEHFEMEFAWHIVPITDKISRVKNPSNSSSIPNNTTNRTQIHES